ncbi:tRNA pseudouridine(38-40) synthase TruA [uncultured Cetobacterium sp.]|uniref:tRNA pseudouridine(38-40) synthase TruA n=1 Tax=uncultured Cetobacterium sp. TaxID=527638 RepID=UPI002629700B|nr:tRNA pseudouridine(38-40) synthase TruA [uncultured Cetobacterium sp.]
MKRNIKLTYSYDGSDFYGFQRQINCRTVQGEIEKILKIIFKENINLVSAGRTDRGVHGKIQVSNFQIESTIPAEKVKIILNNQLPRDIYILKTEDTDLDFHARFSATYRSYEYFISEEFTPFKSRYVTFVDYKLDVEKLNIIGKKLEGIHDFANFRLSDCASRTTIREIYKIEFTKENDGLIKLYVKANAFLKSQIRIIVGSILAEYTNKVKENYIEDMLNNPSINYKKIVAEPYGLHLSEIGY